MQLFDPTVTGPERHNTRAVAPNRLDGLTIGILENGKLNAVEMLQETAALFEARHGCTVAPLFSKRNASAPAPAETLAAAVDKLATSHEAAVRERVSAERTDAAASTPDTPKVD